MVGDFPPSPPVGKTLVCVCSIHQNAILLVDATNWDITYKDLILKIVCDSIRKGCMMHQCESCPCRAGLKQFLDELLSDVDSESEFHYNQWDTTDQASLTTVTTICKEYKDLLIDATDTFIFC